MTARRVDPWCCRVVELAARALPAGQRQRYALEFIAELYDRPRWQQIRHAALVLAHARALRTALVESGSADMQEEMMTVTTRQSLRCRLSAHRWHWASTEDGGRYECCLLCGKDRTGKLGSYKLWDATRGFPTS